ncbi:putative transporter svop-1 [Bolinopsis microptera]|uniref:putative transporter svop-1 n=1 Tax=Bolinopsis microptera TaxID=2820187 RepID=UPI00307A441C
MDEDEITEITTDGDTTNTIAKYGSTSQASDEKLLELNEIYEMIGLGPAQYLYWTLVALVAYSDYAELTVMAVILPSLRCEWGLTAGFEAAITISTYGSYALFAIMFGKVSDIYGRKTVIQWSTLLLLFAAIGGALSPNKWVFLATRLVTGACIGINLSCIVCYTAEFAESKYRVYGVLGFIFGAHGSIGIVSGVAFLVLNNVGWQWLIIIVSLPAIPALILILALPESPRFLCVSGQQEKAMKAVRTMAKLNRRELQKDIRMACFNDEKLGSYTKILNKDNRKSTIALSVMYFCDIFIGFGLIVWLPLIYSANMCGDVKTAQHENTCQSLTQGDLLKLTIATVASLSGSIAAVILVPRIGRLIPMRVATFIMLLSIATLFVCVNDSFTFATTIIAKIVETFVNTTLWIMIPESFPTCIRSTATGFINSCGKIGGVFGTACVYLLFYVSPYSVVGIFLFISFVGFVGTMVYDRETKYEILQEK